MGLHYYLSLIPEALVVSMLPPDEFGKYYALGSRQRTRGQAMFFELDAAQLGGEFPLEEAEKRCVAHSDGRSRKSTYLSLYRVLERVPLKALRVLYLTTPDGRSLALSPQDYDGEGNRSWHLYQEICPVLPRVVSRLDPLAFGKRLTDTGELLHLPKLVYADMKLEQLADDPESMEVENLPYMNLQHLRDCLMDLKNDSEKVTKTVNRSFVEDVLYRTVRNGFFVAGGGEVLFFPLPSRKTLETEHYLWWRSALSGSVG
ncbi:MAG: hypothetical protein LAT55_03750 [Opitutales bacterium]|nr:hypothetical protein [Opitutales bacterium]